MEIGEIPKRGFNNESASEFAESPTFEEMLKFAGGDRGTEMADILSERGEATAEELSREMGVKITLVRKTLYDLYEARIVSVRRSRDSQTGWINYHWHLEPAWALKRLNESKQSLLREARKQLRREQGATFFACENNCVRVEFEEAMDLGFRCPECDGKLHEFDSGNLIQSLKERIEKLEGELEQTGPKE